MKETANRGKGKTLLISAGIEIMLIICIMAANLNPTPILYFIFYNLLYGLVFSLLIPLYCLYKENGAPASGRVLAEAGFKKLGIRQFWFPEQCSPFTIWAIRDSALGRTFFCCLQ